MGDDGGVTTCHVVLLLCVVTGWEEIMLSSFAQASESNLHITENNMVWT